MHVFNGKVGKYMDKRNYFLNYLRAEKANNS